MGGKSYFCDYCCCYLKNDINVRKVHNSGLMHKIAKVTYMRRFEDPCITLREESEKTPCSRYLKGYCKFDLFCQYSHYSPKQLDELKHIVERKLNQRDHISNKSKNINQKKFPNRHRQSVKKLKKLNITQLPPSLRPYSINSINLNKQFNKRG